MPTHLHTCNMTMDTLLLHYIAKLILMANNKINGHLVLSDNTNIWDIIQKIKQGNQESDGMER